jgi:hypothetical protein
MKTTYNIYENSFDLILSFVIQIVYTQVLML